MLPYCFFPPCTVPGVRQVDLGFLVADGDVDLALGDDVVGDLVVLAPRQPLLLQVVPREDVVDVAISLQ